MRLRCSIKSSRSILREPDQIPAPSCQLYLITPPRFRGGAEGFAESLAEALDEGPIACVQLRLKDAEDDEIRRAVDRLRGVAQDRDVAFILNDRPDLAAELGCDGVHIGQDDGSFEDARSIVGEDAIVGVTCKNSRHLAMEAAEAGADYVAFGAFFASATKEVTTAADPDILSWWQEIMTVPCVAIGGITPQNCRVIVESGADFLAVSGSVWNDPSGPASAIRTFQAVLSDP